MCKVPSWWTRMKEDSHSCNKFEDVRDIYTYLRSTRRLLERSSIDTTNVEEKIQYVFGDEGFLSMEHIEKVIRLLVKMKIGPEVSYTNRLIEFDLTTSGKEEIENVSIGKEYLKQGGRFARTRSWQWRLESAITAALKRRWFPLFGTYTVDPKKLPEGCLTRDELWTKTPSWDRFMKKMKTEVAEACGYGRRPAQWPIGSSFFQYFAVLEHGKSGQHPHVHVVFLCKAMPQTWKVDPNRNCATRMLVDIPAASSLWPHGVQRKTMALFIIGSWFTENWVIPIEANSGKPVKVGDAGAVAGYIAKYLQKGETKKWKHRVKATKNLGLEKLTHQLQNLKSEALLFRLALRPAEYRASMLIQQATSCPLNLLREKSRKELMRRLHSMKRRRAKQFLRMEWTRRPHDFYTDFMQSVKDGLRPWTMMPEQRYSLYTLMLGEVNSTVHSKQNRSALMKWLNECLKGERASRPFTLLKVVQ